MKMYSDSTYGVYKYKCEMVKVEKDDTKIKSSRGYPYELLEVGEFFIVPTTEEDLHRIQGRMSASNVYYQNELGRKFVTRKIDDGIMIMRTE